MKELNLGLVPASPSQVVRLPEPSDPLETRKFNAPVGRAAGGRNDAMKLKFWPPLVTPLVEEPIATGGWPFLHMTKRVQFKRVLLLLAVLVLAFAGLGFRLVDLQVVRHDELAKLAQDDTQHEFWQAPRRGDILDARGNPLATSIPVKTVCADPSLIGNQQAVVARALAPLLQMNEADLYQKLFPRVSKNEKGETVTNNLHYVRLAEKCLRRHLAENPIGDDQSHIRSG